MKTGSILATALRVVDLTHLTRRIQRKLVFCALALAVLPCFCVMGTSAAHAQTLTTLYNFVAPGNAVPSAGLVMDSKGNLDGTAGGTVFELNAKDKYTVLYRFKGVPDGADPDNVSLLRDSKGDLYGATAYGGTGACTNGGAAGCGTIFKVTGKKEKVLYSFQGAPDGWGPDGALIGDSAGNLYGTTFAGGLTTDCAGGCGTIFELPSTGTEKVLYRFCSQAKCADGGAPQGGMAADASGNLYGTTSGGGKHLHGTVFELTKAGTYKVLYNFCATKNCMDGAIPIGGLVVDSAGNLYGTTEVGGGGSDGKGKCGDSNDGCGTVFEVNASGKYSVRHNFIGPPGDAAGPVGGLVLDAAGNLYGTAPLGGNATPPAGIVFKLDSSNNETILWNFDVTDGSAPNGTLIIDAKGNLYGTTPGGGANNNGTIFKLTP
jgi:uncharacterized repeat protein (TIGR03803 family)